VPKYGFVYQTIQRPEGDNPRTVAELARLLDGSKEKYGARYQRRVADGYNPFGPSDYYISIYRGWINIATAGKYQFCTVSNEASFSFLDGKELIHWPGRHTAERGMRGEVARRSAGGKRQRGQVQGHQRGEAAVETRASRRRRHQFSWPQRTRTCSRSPSSMESAPVPRQGANSTIALSAPDVWAVSGAPPQDDAERAAARDGMVAPRYDHPVPCLQAVREHGDNVAAARSACRFNPTASKC